MLIPSLPSLGWKVNNRRGMWMIPLNIFIFRVMSFWSQTDLWPQKPGAKLSSGDLPLSAFATYYAENFLHFSLCWIFSFLSPKCFSLSYCFLVLLVHLPTRKDVCWMFSSGLCMSENVLILWSHFIDSLALSRIIRWKSVSYRVLRLCSIVF